MRNRLHVESCRSAPVGVVLEAAIGIGTALFGEGDGGSGGIHVVIERPVPESTMADLMMKSSPLSVRSGSLLRNSWEVPV